jgi:methionyl-tRNA synthetase
MQNKPLYLTTTLPYVNADPHIGFALEIVQADAVARYQRLMGRGVFFNTGTDEHGQKIWEAAEKSGQDVQEYVDHFAQEFRKLKEALDLSNDTFVRTTDAAHKAAAQEIWRRCAAAEDIYKKEYEGLYCVGCERFYTEKELVDGKCAIHLKEPVLLKEENYFFRFSKYADALKEYLSRPGVILPEWRREEAIAFVGAGLEDFSISRERSRLSWGVPVPDDDSQVMYVWFDALTNYISTLGWPNDTDGRYQKFWVEGETVQFAGKDQVRFQSLMWQAMLMSANLKPTDQIFYHGFINSGGTKMSKSLGNVINPYDVVGEYGIDATRYYLLRHIHPFDDSDITMEKFRELYNAHLANGLGNLAARIMTLAEKHLEGPIERPEEGLPEEYTSAIESFEFNKAMDYIWSRIGALDEKITHTEPFKVVKGDPAMGRALIAELATELYLVARLLNPFMPETNEKLKEAILANKKPDNLFLRKE